MNDKTDSAALALVLDASESPHFDPIGDELSYYWQSLEAALGFHSSQGSVVNRLNGLTGTRSDAFSPFEQFACWENAVGKRMARVAKALRSLPSDVAQVLYRAYGPRDPSTRRSLGEAASLAEYTPTVERHRERMVEERIQQRLRVMRVREEQREQTATAIAAMTRARITETEQEIIRLRELRGERGLSEEERAELLSYKRALAAAKTRLDEALRPKLTDEAMERAAQGMRISTNLEITTADALRALLDEPIRMPGEAAKMFARRLKVGRQARAEIAARISEEAAALLAWARDCYAFYASAAAE